MESWACKELQLLCIVKVICIVLVFPLLLQHCLTVPVLHSFVSVLLNQWLETLHPTTIEGLFEVRWTPFKVDVLIET